MPRRRPTRALAYVFIVLAAIAAVLNSIAAVVNARDGDWVSALLYLIIAVTIGTVAFVGWYSMARQEPYRWRDEDP
jgi:DMSO/TMAO reductase YedYZ heme-binding membrane subunit